MDANAFEYSITRTGERLKKLFYSPSLNKQSEGCHFSSNNLKIFRAIFLPSNCNHTWISRFLYLFSKNEFFYPDVSDFQKSFSRAFNNTVGNFKQNLIKFLKISQKIFCIAESKRKKPLSLRGERGLIAAKIINMLMYNVASWSPNLSFFSLKGYYSFAYTAISSSE